MDTQSQLAAIKARVENKETTLEQLRNDAQTLLAQFSRQQTYSQELTARVELRLHAIEQDMELLEQENQRLRRNAISTFFERDACVGLLIRLAVAQGMTAGLSQRETEHGTERLVVLDLPSGQVSWEYLDTEAHLFDWLPQYSGSVKDQEVTEIYSKVMNPGLQL
jgi:hypothetical protein